MLRIARPWTAALAIALVPLVLACNEDPAPAPAPPTSADGDANATIFWNQAARELLATLPPQQANPIVQARLFAYLSIAQHNAIVEAERRRTSASAPSPTAAAASAGDVVLRTLLPTLQSEIGARLATLLARPRFTGESSADVEAGLAVGRSIAAAVTAWAATDGTGQTAPPPNPAGAGNWRGANPILGLYGARLIALESANQFLPPPPPAFGSPAFQAALDETRSLVQNRTSAQIASATYWHPRNNAALNETAVELISTAGRTERDAARILAIANIAGFDMLNACFAAKFAYWYIRPSQADPSITFIPGVGLPNHPAYPSAHSCGTGAYAAVLEREFPSARDRLAAQVQEAGLSRMIAGFHYRFDVEAGERLGRAVGEWVWARAVKPGTPIALR